MNNKDKHIAEGFNVNLNNLDLRGFNGTLSDLMQQKFGQRVNKANPDTIEYNGKTVLFKQGGAYPFIIMKDGSVYWGKEKQMHSRMVESIVSEKLYGKPIDWDELDDDDIDQREELYEKCLLNIWYMGRLFTQFLAITYWNKGVMKGDVKAVSFSDVEKIVDSIVSSYKGLNKSRVFVQWNGQLIRYAELAYKNGNSDSELVSDTSDLNDQQAIHLASQEEKREKLGQYLRDRSKKQSDKLSSGGREMSRAEYNALRRPFSESKEINEELAWSFACPDSVDSASRKVSYDWMSDTAYPFVLTKDGDVWFGEKGEIHGGMFLRILGIDSKWKAEDYYHNRQCHDEVDEQIGDEVYICGRVYSAIPAVTYWNRGNKHSFDEIKKMVSIVASKANFDVKKLMVQFDTTLIPYDVFMLGERDAKNYVESEIADGRRRWRILWNKKKLGEKEALHLADMETKREQMKNFLSDRAYHQTGKLANGGKEMSRAEYNARKRPYSESKGLFGGLLEKIIKENNL